MARSILNAPAPRPAATPVPFDPSLVLDVQRPRRWTLPSRGPLADLTAFLKRFRP